MLHDNNNNKQINRMMNEVATQRKANADTQYFWDLVNRNKGYNNQNNNRKVNKQQEEKMLFGKKVESAEHGFIDDNIPVERSGQRADEIPVLSAFSELQDKIPEFLMDTIKLMRYEKPTPIQKHAIPLGLEGVDLMCCAQTGSGKTFSFLLPVVDAMYKDRMVSSSDNQPGEANKLTERISIDDRGALPKGVILAPTRELASQIHLDARRLTFGSNIKSVCVYGGNDLRVQLQELSVGCDLIVATPGRLNDLVDRGCVSLSQVTLLVLDEADRMLDMGFEPQIRRIIQENDMPPTGSRQTFLFSATFPDEIQKLAREFLHNYVWIGVGRVGSTVDNIKQQIICASADPHDKIKLLINAIEQTSGRTLVFVQKRRTASWLVDCLRGQFHVKAEEIHGDRSQAQRENALKQFRDGHIRILVATDVAARGLDVPEVTHVIQFDLPISADDFDVYVHRIGRTGRAGKGGMATALYVPGRETGEGNGKIAGQMLRLLTENNQEVPEWFAALDDLKAGIGRSTGGAYRQQYQQSNKQAGGYQQKFGYRDVRGNQDSYMYTEPNLAAGGYGNYGGRPNQYQSQQPYQQRAQPYQQQQQGYQQPYQQQGYQPRGMPYGGRGGYNNQQQQQGYNGGGRSYNTGAEVGGYQQRSGGRQPQDYARGGNGGMQYYNQSVGYGDGSAYYGHSPVSYDAGTSETVAPEVYNEPVVPRDAQMPMVAPIPNPPGYYDPYMGGYVAAPVKGEADLTGQFGNMSVQSPVQVMNAYDATGGRGRVNPNPVMRQPMPYVPAAYGYPPPQPPAFAGYPHPNPGYIPNTNYNNNRGGGGGGVPSTGSEVGGDSTNSTPNNT